MKFFYNVVARIWDPRWFTICAVIHIYRINTQRGDFVQIHIQVKHLVTMLKNLCQKELRGSTVTAKRN